MLYHIVFSIKYRKKVLTKDIEETIKDVCCIDIELGYKINKIYRNRIRFRLSITQIIKIIKSITIREIFKIYPKIKK
ncbi:MAG: transposase [Rickettsiales bacterium]|nr:transposase [Rickettsiales bacterium]